MILNDDDIQLTEEERATFDRLSKQANSFYRSVSLTNRLNAAPNDYGTGEMSSMAEAHMMIDICDNPGITVGELAEMTQRTPSAISQVVSKLECKGCVYKERGEENYRLYHIYPTKKGRRLAVAHEKYDIEQMTASQNMMLTRFSREEIDLFYRMMDYQNELLALDLQELRAKNSGKSCCEKDK